MLPPRPWTHRKHCLRVSLRDICPGSKTLLSSAGNLSERDIENKFSSLSLAFKTDRVSLQERHELQLRQRDIAERNVATEIRQLGASIRYFSILWVCQKVSLTAFQYFWYLSGAWAGCARTQRRGRFWPGSRNRWLSSFSVPMYLSVSMYLSVPMYLSVALYFSVSSIFLWVCVSQWLCISLCPIFLYGSVFLYFCRCPCSRSRRAEWLPPPSSTGRSSRRPGWPLPSR